MDRRMEMQEGAAQAQYKQLAFMAEVCSRASSLGMAALGRGEKLDVRQAFEFALMEIVEHDGRTKNELTALWSMLLLGSEAVKKLCAETDSFTVGRRLAKLEL
jgi:hypothetical protein